MITKLKKRAGNKAKLAHCQMLSQFIIDSFDLIYVGAKCLENPTNNVEAIEADYYAPRRVQFGDSRFHEKGGLKYCDGFKYSDAGFPTKEQCDCVVDQLNILVGTAEQVIAIARHEDSLGDSESC